ncbi:MAG: HAMP domain-containing histidine kinase [Elusimicrobia bacterium]|nr:HAMP domain-containing histidine kinase [Elusimicrobiota bacterium]
MFRSGLPLLRESAAAGGDLRVRRMLDMFAEGSARLLRMADGILGLARLEDPAAPIDRRAVDLAGLARARVEAADAAAKEKGVSLDLRAGPGLPPCPADADLVGRVLDNLLSNALEHTPKGGKVQVGLERREDVLRVEVRDTGPGVPAAERERIFEKFRKGRASSRGAGLGLAFCRLAVERHGGAIGVSDVERGGGSVFYFTLPII